MTKCFSLVLLAAPALIACGDDHTTTSTIPDNAAAAIANYAAIAEATYDDSVTLASALDDKVAALVASPSAETLADARSAWIAGREPYLRTEVFRFYDGPIDDPATDYEGQINSWPLDENYIDYVEGDANAGIVNDPSVDISAAELAALNAEGGDTNISTGWHAIEFLLWGQDHSDTGPGDRPFTDYTTATNADRRKLYLSVATQQLEDLLTDVQTQWVAGAANYRASFVAVAPKEALRRILTGMALLSGNETGGERLQAALDSKSQEDEHSCFSDNTHRDMIADIIGIQNVWRGSYTKLDGTVVSGTGIRDVVAAADPLLSAKIEANIDASLALANALHVPFDQEIKASNPEGNARVQALVVSLQAQAGLIEQAFTLFDLTVPVPE